MIHRHYGPREILWFLRHYWKYSREEMICAYHEEFNDPNFGKSQYQWLKTHYGLKAEWGAPLNDPPFPGALPGSSGAQNYESPHVPRHPPQATFRTQSESSGHSFMADTASGQACFSALSPLRAMNSASSSFVSPLPGQFEATGSVPANAGYTTVFPAVAYSPKDKTSGVFPTSAMGSVGRGSYIINRRGSSHGSNSAGQPNNDVQNMNTMAVTTNTSRGDNINSGGSRNGMSNLNSMNNNSFNSYLMPMNVTGTSYSPYLPLASSTLAMPPLLSNPAELQTSPSAGAHDDTVVSPTTGAEGTGFDHQQLLDRNGSMGQSGMPSNAQHLLSNYPFVSTTSFDHLGDELSISNPFLTDSFQTTGLAGVGAISRDTPPTERGHIIRGPAAGKVAGNHSVAITSTDSDTSIVSDVRIGPATFTVTPDKSTGSSSRGAGVNRKMDETMHIAQAKSQRGTPTKRKRIRVSIDSQHRKRQMAGSDVQMARNHSGAAASNVGVGTSVDVGVVNGTCPSPSCDGGRVTTPRTPCFATQSSGGYVATTPGTDSFINMQQNQNMVSPSMALMTALASTTPSGTNNTMSSSFGLSGLGLSPSGLSPTSFSPTRLSAGGMANNQPFSHTFPVRYSGDSATTPQNTYGNARVLQTWYSGPHEMCFLNGPHWHYANGGDVYFMPPTDGFSELLGSGITASVSDTQSSEGAGLENYSEASMSSAPGGTGTAMNLNQNSDPRTSTPTSPKAPAATTRGRAHHASPQTNDSPVGESLLQSVEMSQQQQVLDSSAPTATLPFEFSSSPPPSATPMTSPLASDSVNSNAATVAESESVSHKPSPHMGNGDQNAECHSTGGQSESGEAVEDSDQGSRQDEQPATCENHRVSHDNRHNDIGIMNYDGTAGSNDEYVGTAADSTTLRANFDGAAYMSERIGCGDGQAVANQGSNVEGKESDSSLTPDQPWDLSINNVMMPPTPQLPLVPWTPSFSDDAYEATLSATAAKDGKTNAEVSEVPASFDPEGTMSIDQALEFLLFSPGDASEAYTARMNQPLW